MKRTILVLAAMLMMSLVAGGCYTKVMSLQEYTEVRQGRAVVRPDASYALNYNQRCVTCHTTAELDDRYIDMELQRDMTAHGRRIDPTMWRGMEDVPYAEDVYFPRPVEFFPPVPWWIPPAAVMVGSGGTAPATATDRPRTTGTTRETTRERDTTPTAQSPQSTPSTPAVSTAPPASVAAPSTSGTAAPSVRPRDSGSDTGSGRTRSDGATRDDGNRPR